VVVVVYETNKLSKAPVTPSIFDVSALKSTIGARILLTCHGLFGGDKNSRNGPDYCLHYGSL